MEKGIVKFKDLIIGDRIFQIPVYQRNYSWDTKQLEDLWDDLLYLDSSKKHYYGTILMKKAKEEKHGLKTYEIYDIIDGQQRITTVLIFLREIISHLKNLGDGTEEELTKLEEEYLKYKALYKLELLGDDNAFFRSYVIDDTEYPDATLTSSQRRLKDAKLFFRKNLNKIKKSEAREFGDFLGQFIDKIGNLEIITYPVENDAEAARIFETVNDRGKQLTNLEKTKSFLMQMVYLTITKESGDSASYLRQINDSFSRIFRDFEEIRNTGRGKDLSEDDIQRYHFIVYTSSDVKTSYRYLDFLKEKIRGMYREDKEKCLNFVLEYTKDLEKAFFALKEIINYRKDDEIGILLGKIYILGRVANFYPILITSWIKFKDEQEKIEELLKIIEIFSFRVYSIGRKRSDAGISSIYSLAYEVRSNKMMHVELIIKLMRLIHEYQGTKEFRINLKTENFYSRVDNADKKYLLFEYEKSLREQAREPLDIHLENILSEKFEIEHIWARDASKLNLSEELLETHEQYKDKLGNLTLASDSWNSKWRNSPFADKKKDYKDSNLRVQRELSSSSDWDKKQIEEREKRIVKFVFKRWRVPYPYPCPYKGCTGILKKDQTKCPICGRPVLWSITGRQEFPSVTIDFP